MTSAYLIDVFVRHQVYLERLKAGMIGDFDPVMRKIDRAITDALTKAHVDKVLDLKINQLQKLIDSIVGIEDKLLGTYARDLTKSLNRFSVYEAQWAESALKNALASSVEVNAAKQGLAWAAAKTQPIQATGQLLEDFTRSWSTREILRTEAIIRNAHAQGWTVQQTTLAVRGTKRANYADGILSYVQRDTDALVRTSLQHVSNAARSVTWESNEDIVEGVRFIATLDSRTTLQCAALDQRVFPLDKGPRPPIHINCRSTTIPEMAETAKLLGSTTRAAKGDVGGRVSGNQTYYDWLKNQPAGFQDTAIGVKRAQLLRDGGLSAKEFARLNLGRNFEPLTLDEMRSLDPDAFDRAGL